MVIWPAFRMGQYRVNDHPYHAPQFIECALRVAMKLYIEISGVLYGTWCDINVDWFYFSSLHVDTGCN